MIAQNGVDIGQNRLFAWMREEGYLGKSGCNYNKPTQRSVEMGILKVKETAVHHADGHVTLKRTPKVTGKGQRYFIEEDSREARCYEDARVHGLLRRDVCALLRRRRFACGCFSSMKRRSDASSLHDQVRRRRRRFLVRIVDSARFARTVLLLFPPQDKACGRLPEGEPGGEAARAALQEKRRTLGVRRTAARAKAV